MAYRNLTNGTAGTLVKWGTGGALADSVVTEAGGQIGVNRAPALSFRVEVSAGTASTGVIHGLFVDTQTTAATGYGLIAQAAGAAGTNYGAAFTAIYGTVANYAMTASAEGSGPKNVGAKVSATGATLNYGLLVAAGLVGIGTQAPVAPVHVLSSTLPQLLVADSEANITGKAAAFGVPHYLIAEEPVTLLYGVTLSASNLVYVGGGPTGMNAATEINLYTAADNSTTGGTARVTVNSSGNVGINCPSPTLAQLQVENTASNITAMFGDTDQTPNVYIYDAKINASYGYDADGANLIINYTGYQKGTTRFRDFNVANGKQVSIFYVSGSAASVGVNTVGPTSNLHVVGTAYPQLRLSSVETNATTKYGMIGTTHYTTAEEPMAGLYMESASASNLLYLGGYPSQMNAATNIGLYTAANNTTTGGTLRLSVDSSGQFVFTGMSGTGPQIVFQDNVTNSTAKVAMMACGHYTTTEEPSAILFCGSYSGTNYIQIGGGASQMNAVTLINFFTAANATTVTGTQVMQMNSSQNVGIGVNADATYRLKVSGTPAASATTLWTNYSDARLKREVRALPDGSLDGILALRPVTFRYNRKTGYDDKVLARRNYGFIAQELEKVFPEMVGRAEIDGTEYLDSNLTPMIPHLVRAVQELTRRVKELGG